MLGRYAGRRAQASLARRFMQTMDLGADMKPGEALSKYTTDLTEIARQGRSDPVIGRADEIRRTIQVLSRRTKNNPILLGQPGTGKTALVEGLAQRIAAGEVPDSIKSKRLLSLDLSAIVAGASFKGEFEKRFKALLKDVTAEHGSVILFADEIHQLVGMGSAGGDSAMDAANIIKPALARGDLRLVGATTFEEYRKYIEKDQALARRFQPVFISEPTVQDTIAILRGLKDKYELWHGVRIADSAVVASANYAKRYLSDRKLPDSAIDLLDESASRLRMEKESKPHDLAEMDRQILTMQIEISALKRETDPDSVARRETLETSLRDMQGRAAERTTEWQKEKERRQSAIAVREKLDDARRQLELAQAAGDFSRAGELKYGVIPALVNEVATLAPVLKSEAVTEDDVAAVISQRTGIPVSRLLVGESDRLLRMEEELCKRVVGQDEAIASISDAIRVARSGLHPPTKPIGTFLFLGSSGCGKTELAKAVAEFMFNDESAMVRIDMSEYSEPHSVARLIGAPPGYVGYDEGGQLTEPVRRRPYSVVLLDEIEKAHRQVDNVLLQLLDEGRLTDGSGKTVDFRNAIVIMTSNLGTVGRSSDYTAKERRRVSMEAVREHFPPEFINRLDEIVQFNDLSPVAMRPICDIQLQRIQATLTAEQRVKLKVDDAARDYLAEQGYDPDYGARPLKRVLQKQLLNPLARLLLSGNAMKGDTVHVTLDDDRKLQFHTHHPDEQLQPVPAKPDAIVAA
ncbi:unnamed protein product (mitochondrion) [Plasmodiophora brassicae]|uniref:Clp R domain-containing protein n=1 Tax=Plasmodiophora brassicae TaxID=37360 RepID=A0A0G4J053_PLABS|nr:hypothetical protein PBRA_008325 [Plasmodiophora brassicae]SPQ95276.1 unnamed protein product [Plasmodiophora brassicae]